MTNRIFSSDTAGQGGVSNAVDFSERQYRMRKLIDAITDCDWHDAEMVMSSMLEEFRAGPPAATNGQIEQEARIWAAMASFDELRAYFIAAARKLVRSGLGVRGRVQLASRLLADLPVEDRRRAFSDLTKNDHST